MLQDVHTRKIAVAVEAPAGDTVIIPRNADEWHYIHELIGDMDAAGTLEIIAIDSDSTEHSLGLFNLGDGQGLTLQDEPGEDNRPRFEFNPDQNAVLRATGGEFNGALHWSIRN